MKKIEIEQYSKVHQQSKLDNSDAPMKRQQLGGIYLYNQNFQRKLDNNETIVYKMNHKNHKKYHRQMEIDRNAYNEEDLFSIEDQNIQWFIKEFISKKQTFFDNIKSQKGQLTQQIYSIIHNLKNSQKQALAFLQLMKNNKFQQNPNNFTQFEELFLSIVGQKTNKSSIYFKRFYNEIKRHLCLQFKQKEKLKATKRYGCSIADASCQTQQDLQKIINELQLQLTNQQLQYKSLYNFKKQLLINAQEMQYNFKTQLQQKAQIINKMTHQTAFKTRQIFHLKNMLKQNEDKIMKMVQKILQNQQQYNLLQRNEISQISKNSSQHDQRYNQFNIKKQKHRIRSDSIISLIKQLNGTIVSQNRINYNQFLQDMNQSSQNISDLPFNQNLDLFQIKEKVRNQSDSNLSSPRNQTKEQRSSIYKEDKQKEIKIQNTNKTHKRYSSELDKKLRKKKVNLTRGSFQKPYQLLNKQNSINFHSIPANNSFFTQKHSSSNNYEKIQLPLDKQSKIIKKHIQQQKKSKLKNMFNKQYHKFYHKFQDNSVHQKSLNKTHFNNDLQQNKKSVQINKSSILNDRSIFQQQRKKQQLKQKQQKLNIISNTINYSQVFELKRSRLLSKKKVKSKAIDQYIIHKTSQTNNKQIKNINNYNVQTIYKGLHIDQSYLSPQRYSQNVSPFKFKVQNSRKDFRSTFSGHQYQQKQRKEKQYDKQYQMIKMLALKCLTKNQYLKEIMKYHKGCPVQNCQHIKRYLQYFNKIRQKSNKKLIKLRINNLHHNIGV